MDLGPDRKSLTGIPNELALAPGSDLLIAGEPAIEGVGVDPDDEGDAGKDLIEPLQSFEDGAGGWGFDEALEPFRDGQEPEDSLQPEIPAGQENSVERAIGRKGEKVLNDPMEQRNALGCSGSRVAIGAED
ncbi:MAG: hypothetical protein ACOVQ6_16180 [Brevundimonas sp.]